MKFKQHIPNFFSGVDPHEEEFDSLEELLNIDVVKRFKTYEEFYQYSVGEYGTLMAEYKEGYEWFVVGYIDKPIEGLPIWIAKYDKEQEAKELEERVKELNKESAEKEKQRVKTYLEEMETSVFDILGKIPITSPESSSKQMSNVNQVKHELEHIRSPYSLHQILDLYCKGDYNAELLLQHSLRILINNNFKFDSSENL